jgi:hypothetical protein
MSGYRESIRTLRLDELIPTSAPRRYIDGRGYVRLRWKVAVGSYVEEYEHRLVVGRPEADVHHIDGDKANNDPSNLRVLSREEHAALHVDQHRRAGRYRGSRRDIERASRRATLDAHWACIAAEYASGASSVELGERYGRHPSNITRGLHARGYAVRTELALHLRSAS